VIKDGLGTYSLMFLITYLDKAWTKFLRLFYKLTVMTR
jgi:hypothetical protein